jgi:predicted double-glycine peptidase
MKRFQLIRQTRQTTEYSCGACALQSVLGYWGREVDEAELMQRLGARLAASGRRGGDSTT